MNANGRVILQSIGWVRSTRNEAIDDDWDKIETRIELDPKQFTPAAVASLDQFSHIEVIFHFDRVPDDEIVTGGRHPRGRKDWPLVGIFAQRAKGRPNRIGSTACRLLGVDGLTLRVQGLDAIEGTPVLDIKPVMKGFLPRGEIREPAWATELLEDYW
ncbi:MAG: SAM-dependent methyltransferase [Proteobacteria bacterium]|nr:SAM-dependent methyltransferase [Pseudomonadota bacterium]